ncbi:MAG TPA: DUF4382 domain-containing protein [Longimicrobiales bacterium]|nr:DUF4382 domain-containing protein [Longimicrobiales bacterium]
MMRKNGSLAVLAALALAGAAACDDTTGTGSTTLRVLLTDAPADYIDSAFVDIGAIQLLPDDGAPITLTTDGTDGFVDLLQLQGAATTLLAEADIEPGTYHQLRLIVEAARVRLVEGYTFTDGSTEKDLFVPSGAQTGIKLNLGVADGEEDGAGLEILPGQMVLVLDFDVSQSFVIQGNPETPAGIMSILFKPTLRVIASDVAATISGTVSTAVEGLSVGELTVTAEPVEGSTMGEFQSQTATTPTAADGKYTLYFLVPGTYKVTVAAPEGYVSDPTEISVTVGAKEDATGADFQIVAN